jgi:type III secretion system HrpE/YscL family protein
MNANVIKVSAIGGTFAGSIVTKEAFKASRDASEIIAQAEERAAQILVEAEKAKQSLFDETVEKGYAAGLGQWNDILADAWKRHDIFLSQHEPELVKLAVAIAKKIIGQTAQHDAEVVVHTVREALKSVRSGHKITIKVNPAEEDTIRKQATALKTLSAEMGEFTVIPHDSVEAGGCIVESELGVIDARIAVQLESIEQAMLRRFDVSDH